MIIEPNTNFNAYDVTNSFLYKGRYRSRVVYGNSILQVFRKLLLIAFSN